MGSAAVRILFDLESDVVRIEVSTEAGDHAVDDRVAAKIRV
jgi:hypothetical protein